MADMNEELSTETTPTAPKIRFKPRLIKKPKVKELALQIARANPCQARAKMFTRVSDSFYEACEAYLVNFMRSRIKSHPSKGKTLT